MIYYFSKSENSCSFENLPKVCLCTTLEFPGEIFIKINDILYVLRHGLRVHDCVLDILFCQLIFKDKKFTLMSSFSAVAIEFDESRITFLISSDVSRVKFFSPKFLAMNYGTLFFYDGFDSYVFPSMEKLPFYPETASMLLEI